MTNWVEIDFNDIRPGDRIRSTQYFDDNRLESRYAVRVGIAEFKSSDTVSGGFWTAKHENSSNHDQVIVLAYEDWFIELDADSRKPDTDESPDKFVDAEILVSVREYYQELFRNFDDYTDIEDKLLREIIRSNITLLSQLLNAVHKIGRYQS